MKNEFIKNQKVEELKKEYKGEKIANLEPKLIEKAFISICDKWNKNESSRKFIIHLVNSFYPVSRCNKVFDFPEKSNRVCCLTKKKLASIREIANYQTDIVLTKTRCSLSGNYTELNKIVNNIPEEIKVTRFGYFSNSSDVFLSGEGLLALHQFIVKINLFPKPNLRKRCDKNNDVQKVSNHAISDLISKENLEKLKTLKK